MSCSDAPSPPFLAPTLTNADKCVVFPCFINSCRCLCVKNESNMSFGLEIESVASCEFLFTFLFWAYRRRDTLVMVALWHHFFFKRSDQTGICYHDTVWSQRATVCVTGYYGEDHTGWVKRPSKTNNFLINCFISSLDRVTLLLLMVIMPYISE